jgi:hypothetical protein
MTRWFVVLVLAVVSSGCATFGSLTPGSNSDKGVWVAKNTSFLGIQMSNQEVLFCTNPPGGAPSCTKAGGDVAPSKTGQ